MDPLYLTEANRDSIRALIKKISPQFVEEMWERVRIKREEEEASSKYAEALKAMQAQQQGQWTTVQYGGVQPATITAIGAGGPTMYYPTGIGSGLSGTTVVSPVTFSGIVDATTATAVSTPGFTNYTSIGAPFTALDPMDKIVQEMGLTKKGGGWSK